MSLFAFRREDRRNLAVGFVSLLTIMTAHSIMETARDTLFLSRLPATDLPWAYLAIAVLATIELQLHQRFLLPLFRDRRILLSMSLVIGSLITVGFWFSLDSIGSSALLAFYVWTGLLITVILIQFWLLLDDSVTVTQAKRIFAPIAAGGVVGAVFGAFIADFLLRIMSPQELLVAAAAVMAIAAATPFLWTKQPIMPAGTVEALESEHRFPFRSLVRDSYLNKLLVLVLIGTITLTGVDYVFKSVVAETIEPEELGFFFARFYMGLNGIALVVQLMGAGWLLRSLGVHRSAALLPLLLFAGILGFLVGPILVAAIGLKAVDGSLRHSLYRTSVEVLYLPLGSARRARAKNLIEGFGHRGGQALASLLILGGVGLGLSSPQIGLMLLVPLALWLLAIMATRERYVELFRSRLRQGAIETRLELEELDLHSLEALLNALNSDQDEEVLSAIDLFDRHGKANLIPVLVLYHPSTSVRLRALEAFSEARDPRFVRVARRMLDDPDCEVKAAALRALTAVEPDEELLAQRLETGRPIEQATALVGLLSMPECRTKERQSRLDGWIRDGSPETRSALARAIRHQDGGDFHDALIALVQSEEEDVALEAIRAMTAKPDPRYLPYLLPFLGRGLHRPAARRAMVAMGETALNYLDSAMRNPAIPRKVRRHLPRTISRFEPGAAAEILIEHLREEKDDAVHFKILRGLGRLRASHPSLRLDQGALQEHLRKILSRAVLLARWRAAVETQPASKRTPSGELLWITLRELENSALERASRLMGVLYAEEDFALVWRGLKSENARVEAASREVLEATLPSAIRETVLALVDDSPTVTRAAMAASALGESSVQLTQESALGAMLHDWNEALRCIAAHQIAELNMQSLQAELERAQPEERGLVRETIERALQILREGTAQPEVSGVA